MKTIILTLTITLFFGACVKKSNTDPEERIQKIIEENNQSFDELNKEIDKVVQETKRAVELAATATVFDFVDKVVKIEILDSKGEVKLSYLSFFSLDPLEVNYRSRVETILTGESIGLCLSLTSNECNASYNYQELAKKVAQQTGHFKMPPFYEKQFGKIPSMSAARTTRIDKINKNSIMATLIQDDLARTEIKVRLSTIGSLSNMQHDFTELTEDKSQRLDVSQVQAPLNSLSSAVVQIFIDSTGSILRGSGKSFGTGFFISNDGYMLTNNHVVDSSKECMQRFKCHIVLRQLDQNDVSKIFIVNASLLMTDVDMDFALFKIEVPEEMRISSLEIENTKVESELLTLGFPGDKDQRKGRFTDSREEIQMTYAFGKLVSLFDLSYVTSVYINGGASGSPLLNLNNHKVVAIVSNGNTPQLGEDGSPGYARPIQMINAEFKISDYLNGSKTQRVTTALKMLKASENTQQALEALTYFDMEKTYLGLPTMKMIMLEHTSIEVRRLVKNYLETKALILGPDHE